MNRKKLNLKSINQIVIFIHIGFLHVNVFFLKQKQIYYYINAIALQFIYIYIYIDYRPPNKLLIQKCINFSLV